MQDNNESKWNAVAVEMQNKDVCDAVKQAHKRGITTSHSDDGGIYSLAPNGKKTYIGVDVPPMIPVTKRIFSLNPNNITKDR